MILPLNWIEWVWFSINMHLTRIQKCVWLEFILIVFISKNSPGVHTEKTVSLNQRNISLNQRNISLIYGQRKHFFELKKVLLIQKKFSLIQRTSFADIREKIFESIKLSLIQNKFLLTMYQRNISLIYGQWKNFFELKKVLLIQKMFFDPKK